MIHRGNKMANSLEELGQKRPSSLNSRAFRVFAKKQQIGSRREFTPLSEQGFYFVADTQQSKAGLHRL
jgi:hypothetical protein